MIIAHEVANAGLHVLLTGWCVKSSSGAFLSSNSKPYHTSSPLLSLGLHLPWRAVSSILSYLSFSARIRLSSLIEEKWSRMLHASRWRLVCQTKSGWRRYDARFLPYSSVTADTNTRCCFFSWFSRALRCCLLPASNIGFWCLRFIKSSFVLLLQVLSPR